MHNCKLTTAASAQHEYKYYGEIPNLQDHSMNPVLPTYIHPPPSYSFVTSPNSAYTRGYFEAKVHLTGHGRLLLRARHRIIHALDFTLEQPYLKCGIRDGQQVRVFAKRDLKDEHLKVGVYVCDEIRVFFNDRLVWRTDWCCGNVKWEVEHYGFQHLYTAVWALQKGGLKCLPFSVDSTDDVVRVGDKEERKKNKLFSKIQ